MCFHINVKFNSKEVRYGLATNDLSICSLFIYIHIIKMSEQCLILKIVYYLFLTNNCLSYCIKL